MFVGDGEHDAPAGACALLPRGVPHTFAVESGSARMLVVCTPGGFEGMFDAVPARLGAASTIDRRIQAQLSASASPLARGR